MNSVTDAIERSSALKPDTSLQTRLDTIIYIPESQIKGYEKNQIASDDAEEIIYSHFRRKGVLSKKELEYDTHSNPEIVEFDTVYNFKIQNSSVAVAAYWLGPKDLNGHCFQTQHALLISSKNGDTVYQEQILPSNYIIDSVTNSSIYGYVYDCGGRGVLRKFTLTFSLL